MTETNTVKTRIININNKYITHQLEFSTDIPSRNTLHMRYIIVAVNTTFHSIPITIRLDMDNLYLIGSLRYFMNIFNASVKDEAIYTIHLKESNIDRLMFEAGEIDDVGRKCITMSYLMDSQLSEFNIPIDIFSTFIDMLIKILEDGGIVEDVPEESDFENNEEPNKGEESDETAGGVIEE